jgi:iron complex transport system substrate-binding protein
LDVFTNLTGRADLREEYGGALKARVDALLSRIPSAGAKPKVLLIRSTTTAAKALKDDHMTGIMLADLGAVNIASRYESLLEDLSLELILDEDPDFIFVVTTGDTVKSLETLQNGLMANPAWTSLSAAREGRFHVLPKDLFHFKPNARWAESYEYLYEILYP